MVYLLQMKTICKTLSQSVSITRSNLPVNLTGKKEQFSWDDWDRQIAEDFDEGRLDFLMREADEARNEGDIPFKKMFLDRAIVTS